MTFCTWIVLTLINVFTTLKQIEIVLYYVFLEIVAYATCNSLINCIPYFTSTILYVYAQAAVMFWIWNEKRAKKVCICILHQNKENSREGLSFDFSMYEQ